MELNVKKIPKARWVRIIPIIIFANIVQWIGKSIISFALPGGMANELALNASISGLLGTVFSIGYLFLQVPFGSAAAKGRAKKLIGLSFFGWVVSLYFLGAATSGTEALIFRFILGFIGGGFNPAMFTIIANWFPNEERGRATAAFLASASISQIIIGPMSSILLVSNSWRILFYVSSGACLVLFLLWMLCFTEKPENAKWLSEEEKEYIISSLEAEKVSKKSVEKTSKLEVIKDKNLWKLCFMYFTISFGTIGLAFWMPTMIKTITKTGMTQAGFLSVIPNIFIFVGVLLSGNISDKTQKRRLLAGLSPVIFTGGLVSAMLLQSNPWLSFGVLCVACLFLQGAAPNMWAMLPRLMSPERAGSARGILNTCSSIGGLLSPLLIGYLQDLTGNMIISWMIIFGTCVLGFLVSLTLPKHLNMPIKKEETEENDKLKPAIDTDK